MNNIPVVKSKLIMPQLSNSFFMSERLKKLCKATHDKSVVVINAPAGYGKTTLMVAALNMYRQDCRICWYRLEQEDRDLAVFYAHLIETLFPSEDPQWKEPRKNLKGGDIGSRHQYINAVICQELWAFHNQHKNVRTFIILDDFQQVKESPEITGALQYLINNLPENCSIFVSSRSEADILTVKQKLEKNVLEISYRELCFSEGELKEFLKVSRQIKTERKLIRQIMLNTEGWAAGIIILCQALGKGGLLESGSIYKKTGEKPLLFKYIALEVLKTIETDLMNFLVKVAILRDFTLAAASTIIGEENAQQLVAQCETKGLFLQKVVGADTTYRFHGLFREVLLQVQPQYLTGEEIESLHIKSATYYIEHRIFDRAIEHFIVCGNVSQAVELIARESVELITLEAFEQLRLWFRLLPDDVVSNNAILLLIKSFTYQKGEEDTLILLEKALSVFRKNNDEKMQIRTLFAIIAFYIFRNDGSNIVKALQQALAVAESSEDVIFEGITDVISLYKSVWEENYSGGIAPCTRANSLTQDEDWKWATLMHSCILQYLLGELDTAGSFIKEALEMNLARRTEMLRGFLLVFHSLVLQLRNDRAAFSQAIAELLTTGEKLGIEYMLASGKRLSAIESYCRHDLDTALDLLEYSTDHFKQLGNQPMYSLNKLSRCLWLSGQRSPKELLEEAKEAYSVLASTRPGQCLAEIGLSMLGALSREAGEYEFAEKFLLSSIKKSSSKKAKQVLCGTFLHLAKLYYDAGNEAKGEDALRQAFNIASANGYVMFWDLHLPTLVEMSARSLRRGICADHAVTLVESYYGKEAAEFFRNNAAVTEEENLKDFCKVFISLYSTKIETTSPKIEVRLLGRFGITINGTTISDSSWKTRKIEGILKYLILHRGRTITRESLMELFWPESDKRSASMSLRAALYELRKVLSSHGIPPEGRDSLIHENGGGLTVPVGRMLFVDTDEFQSLYYQLKELPAGESGVVKRIGVLERMISLYRGNLLEDDIYEDWAYFEREELRSLYLESAISLAIIYIGKKDHKKAEKILLKTLAMDQHNEEACLNLLKLYISTNQRGRAIKLYNSFKNRLKKELNIKPEERLTSLIKGIMV
ncbi:MAG: BTAD domain-containing putative transcriptional regulator [Bacillota bacterium]